jgi:hypothetical protein
MMEVDIPDTVEKTKGTGDLALDSPESNTIDLDLGNAMPSGSETGVAAPAYCAGYMTKMDGTLLPEKKRYFVLDKGILKRYKSREAYSANPDNTMGDSLDMKDFTLYIGTEAYISSFISLKRDPSLGKNYKFSLPRLDYLETWAHSINLHKEYRDKICAATKSSPRRVGLLLANSPKPKNVQVCALPGCEVTGVLKVCNGCEKVAYCCEPHQKRAWPDHKEACKEVREEKLNAAAAAQEATIFRAVSGEEAAQEEPSFRAVSDQEAAQEEPSLRAVSDQEAAEEEPSFRAASDEERAQEESSFRAVSDEESAQEESSFRAVSDEKAAQEEPSFVRESEKSNDQYSADLEGLSPHFGSIDEGDGGPKSEQSFKE